MARLQQTMKETVLRLRIADTSAVRPYDETFVPAVEKKGVTPGITWKSFAGHFPWIPQTYVLTPSRQGQAVRPDPSLLQKNESVLLFEGYLKVPEDGVYTFSIRAKGQALLRIHQACVVDADFGYQSGTTRGGLMKAKAGLHPITLYYKRDDGGAANLNLVWSGPGFTNQPIPSNVLFQGGVD
jgi:hypothetical protein